MINTDIARKDWFINKVNKKEDHSHAQVADTSASNKDVQTAVVLGSPSKENNEKIGGWCNAHIEEALCFFQEDALKQCILLDNESTTSIFCNKNYVTNIRNSDRTMNLRTNGGVLQSKQECNVPIVPNLREHWAVGLLSDLGKQTYSPISLDKGLKKA